MKLRRAQGVSQTVLAAELGLDQSGISEIERGERPLTVERLLSIEDALGVERGTLLISSGLVAVDDVEAAIWGAQQLDEPDRELLIEQFRFLASRGARKRK